MTKHGSDQNGSSQPLTIEEVTEALLEITHRYRWAADGGKSKIDAYAKKYLNIDMEKIREQIR